MKPLYLLPFIGFCMISTAGAAELRPADLSSPMDSALVQASGDTIVDGVAKNSCGEVVQPRIAMLGSNQAIEQETGAGACSGSELPDSITLFTRSGAVWKVQDSTIGLTFHFGPAVNGHPDIMIDDPPTQHGCPIWRWNGTQYAFFRACGH